MKLTPDNKTHIDALSYEALVQQWRLAPAGEPWFQDETGKYWRTRMEYMYSYAPVTLPVARQSS